MKWRVTQFSHKDIIVLCGTSLEICLDSNSIGPCNKDDKVSLLAMMNSITAWLSLVLGLASIFLACFYSTYAEIFLFCCLQVELWWFFLLTISFCFLSSVGRLDLYSISGLHGFLLRTAISIYGLAQYPSDLKSPCTNSVICDLAHVYPCCPACPLLEHSHYLLLLWLYCFFLSKSWIGRAQTIPPHKEA